MSCTLGLQQGYKCSVVSTNVWVYVVVKTRKLAGLKELNTVPLDD